MTTTRIVINLLDSTYLEQIIRLIQPDRIIHLAGMSNTEDCERNPIRAIDTNGRVVAHMCDLIFRNKLKCKLFNASSSEIYKGHQTYTVTDNDTTFRPSTVYAIGKVMGHQVVDMYRNKHNLPFSNGILFTTESKLRSSDFLFMKLAIHAREYRKTQQCISVGNLDSWRNVNHAEDVARAVEIIIEQPTGDTYAICSTEFHKVQDVVIQLYKRNDIVLEYKDNCLIETNTGNIVVNVGRPLRNTTITKINGLAEKLKRLGWSPKYSLNTLLDDITLGNGE
jgi:GDPmannose 4,6-dehydratase